MKGRPHSASIRSSSTVEIGSAVQPQCFNPNGTSRLEGRPVVRFPEQLRLHPALEEIGWTGVVDEFNDAARLTSPAATEPILITKNGTILAGLGRWRAAIDSKREINCIEYPLTEDEALQFIIRHHRPELGWNAFVRIRLALTQQAFFQQRALDNMRVGGKYKGLANLPEAQHVDVRQEIARSAGVGTRNVGNVRTLLQNAHSKLIEALQNGTLTINAAMPFCKLSKAEQLERFIRHSEDREISKVIRTAVSRAKEVRTTTRVAALLDALQQQEARQPGSVVVQIGRFKRTVILVGQDLLTGPYSQKELDFHEIQRSTSADSVSDTSPLGPG